MCEKLVAAMLSVTHFTNDEINQIISCFEIKKIRKNEILLREGEICKNLYFVQEGCLRTFSFDADANECTRCIAFEGSYCCILSSFVDDIPSGEFIQALETSQVLFISRDRFIDFQEKIPAFSKIYQYALEKMCASYISRIESLLKLNSRGRYEQLLKKEPVIVQKLSNKIVASYLGITQESLSRVKSKKYTTV